MTARSQADHRHSPFRPLSECGGRPRLAAAAAPHPGKALPARTLTMARRLRMRVDDTCQAHQMRRACRWATRITRTEVAAMNRRARFPASPCVGVLRIASATNLGRPPHRQRREFVGEDGACWCSTD
jgi:hypothetical protein